MTGDGKALRGAANELMHLAEAFDELGALLGASESSAFDALVKVAVERVRGTESASVTTLMDGRFETVAATDDDCRRADLIQYELGSGPCVDAILDEAVYRPTNLATDDRWPEFGRRVSAEVGMASMLSYRLFLERDHVIGGLNLYSRTAGAFDDEAAMVGLLLATHGAMAVKAATSEEQVANLQRALETNRDIGTAIGILMARFTLTRQQAFTVLAVASQRANRKLADIAQEVVETGQVDLNPVRRRMGDEQDRQG